MRSAALDRRVRKEARLLLREARAAGKDAKRRRDGLDAAAQEVAAGLAAGDLARVRRGLPRLDELVDGLPRSRASVVAEYAWAICSLVVLVLSIRAFVVEAFKIPSSSMYPTLEINDHIFVNKFIYGLRVPRSEQKIFERSPARGEVIVFIQPCQPERDYIKRVIALAGDTVEVRCNVVYVNGEAIPSELVPGTCEFRDNQHGRWTTEYCSRYRETLGGITYETFHDPDRPRRDHELRTAGGIVEDDVAGDFPRDAILRSCSTVPPAEGRPSKQQLPGSIVRTREPAGMLNTCKEQLHYVVPHGHVFVMGDHRNGSNDSRVWGSVPIQNIKGKAMFIWWSFFPESAYAGRWSRVGSFVH